jgi:hypothetical protein
VDRFCFLSKEGRYEYFIEYDRKFGDIQLLLYYDEPHQWHSVYKTSKTCSQKVSVLSAIDNQIVTLSAKSPHFMKSGCTLRTASSSSSRETTTQRPLKKSTEEFDSTYFDQFLKATATSPSDDQQSSTTESLNLTDVDIEDFASASPGYKLIDEETQDNNLENSTEFIKDVEEMYDKNENRTKRQIYSRSYEDRKQTIYVSCHNAGGFTSARQRWWYIALANCGSQKGLEVRYKFRMTNGPLGDFWHEHFSADEMCKENYFKFI